jgi:type VI secretion system secreted protein VgrG
MLEVESLSHVLSARPRRNPLSVEVASGAALDVREFVVHQQMSSLFQIDLVVHTLDSSLDSTAIVGKPATFRAESRQVRTWGGICNQIEQVVAEERGYSTYRLSLVPALWLLTQRRNYRIFQQQSDPDIVLALLREWGIDAEIRFDRGAHRPRKYRVQYGESDHAFLSRLLEDAGISYHFADHGRLVLDETPHAKSAREELPYVLPGAPPNAGDCVTSVHVGHRVRPGRYTLRDHDYRKAASQPLSAHAAVGDDLESRLERYHYVDGAFLFGTSKGESTPAADDRGKARHDPNEGTKVAQRRLEAKRASGRRFTFETNALDVSTGTVVTIADHPHEALANGKRLLVVSATLEGHASATWKLSCVACSAEAPYHPQLDTPKPRVMGVESATVVGPPGEEIHTDEFGRVRVHFHWDRYSQMDHLSSCWIHVSQPWAGTGFGGMNIPRVGQEVIVDFLQGDPDRPVIVGRLYTGVQPVPYGLPASKTKSGWKSMSSPGGDGYNELMFEDAKGSELVNIQAEKDMSTLVKHDQTLVVKHDREIHVEHDERTLIDNDRTEEVGNDEQLEVKRDRRKKVDHDETTVIGNDRLEMVGHDERLFVGHDRGEEIGNDEAIKIGHDRAHEIGNDLTEIVGKDRRRFVAANESVLVGANREIAVGYAEQVQIGASQTTSVGEDRSAKIGGNEQRMIGENESTSVGGSMSTTVGKTSNERVTLAKSTTVGGAYSITVGAALSATVGGMSSEKVGIAKSISAGASISITCGASSITMDAAGNVTIKGTAIVINGKTIDLN